MTRRAACLSTPLAAVRSLELGRALRAQLDQLVVEEGHAGLEAEGHGRVVDPLHRVVDEHHLGVERSARSSGVSGAGPREVLLDEAPALVAVGVPLGSAAAPRTAAVVAVEEGRWRTSRPGRPVALIGGYQW
jgi:hypothetical protein